MPFDILELSELIEMRSFDNSQNRRRANLLFPLKRQVSSVQDPFSHLFPKRLVLSVAEHKTTMNHGSTR